MGIEFIKRRCRRCGKKIGVFEKHGKLKKGQRYLFIEGLRYDETVRVGTVGHLGPARPGRLCMACWEHWEESQRQAAAMQVQIERQRKEQKKQRRLREATVSNRSWVLDNMPVASSRTLATYAKTIKEATREDILALGKGQVRSGVLSYNPGDEKAMFFASSGGIAYEWIIVRTGPKSWAIADSEWEYTD